jgi:hypothetical protein
MLGGAVAMERVIIPQDLICAASSGINWDYRQES